ncbi:MAG: hypothetical protein K0S76_788 [Herbinix sp.]|jgi:hypothetical protein|nr:hypothetical protein [Herbinix sp.]
MKKIFKYKRIYILGLLPISYLLIFLAKHSDFFAEQVFARHIYKWVSQMVSVIFGLVPFSVAEILIYSLPLAGLFLIIRFIILMIKDKENRKNRAIKGILNLFCMISILLFIFTITAGINYYRYPFSYYSGLEIKDSSVEELYALTQNLALQANDLRAKTTSVDESGVFKLSDGIYELADKADEAMKALSEQYSVLGGLYATPKPVLLSSMMSRTEITGIFFPFTMEANVNVDISDFFIPVTMLHELAHLRGFMREDEANYIAYLAGMESDSTDIKYSSTMLAMITAGNALYDKEPELYFTIRDQYSEGVLKDIRANSQYWQQYEDTVISTISNKINDTYLKANAQVDGVQSYGRMLDLLLAKFREEQNGN